MRAAKRVVVTGANSGIGLATALEIARRGYPVTGTVRDETKAGVLLDAAAVEGLAVDALIMDVRDADAASMLAAIPDVFALVNNAGMSTFGAIEDVSDDRVEEQVATMLVAPMRLTRAVLPAMIARAEGKIVNVSSIFGFLIIPFNGWYEAVKHGLEAATDALRYEVAGTGVTVTSVQPGAVNTPLWADHQGVVERYAGSRHVRGYQRSLRFMELYRPLVASAEQVAAVIASAVDASRPRSRYLVGIDAHVISALTSVLPAPAQSLIMRTVLGL